jgi:hypothetical protein
MAIPQEFFGEPRPPDRRWSDSLLSLQKIFPSKNQDASQDSRQQLCLVSHPLLRRLNLENEAQ